MSLGTRLTELRRRAGFTQAELGKILNISAQAISKWENDFSEPDISTLKKLAEIYGVNINEIIDPSSVPSDGGGVVDGVPSFDLYLVATDPAKKIKTISYLRNLLGIDLVQAKQAVEEPPYLISGAMSSDEVEAVRNYLAPVGATVEATVSDGTKERRSILSTEEPTPPPATSGGMKKRFIVANVTAALPALAVLIVSIPMCVKFIDYLLAVYFCACTYSLIFLLWYPTLTRKLLYPIRGAFANAEGFFAILGASILAIILLPWLILVWLICPIIYAFSIKTRVRRMLCDDDDDDIFSDF